MARKGLSLLGGLTIISAAAAAGLTLRGSAQANSDGNVVTTKFGTIRVGGMLPIRIPGETNVDIGTDGFSVIATNTTVTLNGDGIDVKSFNTSVSLADGGVNVVTSNTTVVIGRNGTKVIAPNGTEIVLDANDVTVPGVSEDGRSIVKKKPPTRRLGTIRVPGMFPVPIPGSTSVTVDDNGLEVISDNAAIKVSSAGVEVTSTNSSVLVGKEGLNVSTAANTSVVVGKEGTRVTSANGTEVHIPSSGEDIRVSHIGDAISKPVARRLGTITVPGLGTIEIPGNTSIDVGPGGITVSSPGSTVSVGEGGVTVNSGNSGSGQGGDSGQGGATGGSGGSGSGSGTSVVVNSDGVNVNANGTAVVVGGEGVNVTTNGTQVVISGNGTTSVNGTQVSNRTHVTIQPTRRLTMIKLPSMDKAASPQPDGADKAADDKMGEWRTHLFRSRPASKDVMDSFSDEHVHRKAQGA